MADRIFAALAIAAFVASKQLHQAIPEFANSIVIDPEQINRHCEPVGGPSL
jgi:hypothetical protein